MASQGSKSSQGSSGSQNERYKILLNPVRDPIKNFEIDVSDLLQNFMDVVETNSQDIIGGSQREINFAEAALMLQASSSVYGKKVEYLYTLTNQLCQAVHNEKKATGSNKGKDKDMLLTGRHNGDEFVLADDIKYQQKSDLLIADYKSYDHRYNMSAIKPTPLALMPLDEREKGDINIKTILGEVIGNLRDYQMSVCDVLNVGCVFLPTLVFKPEDGEVPLFANSTVLSMGVQDDDPMDVSNVSFSCSGSDGQSQPIPSTMGSDVQSQAIPSTMGSDGQSQPLPSTMGSDGQSQPLSSLDPSPLDMNGMDIENDDNYSVHDDPINDSPASSITPSPAVDDEGNAESQKIDVPMRRRSERQALKLAAKNDKSEKDPYAVKSEDVQNQIVPLKEEPKTPAKKIIPKSRLHRERRKTSCEFIDDMMNKRKKKLAYTRGNLCLDSKNLKNFPLEANIDAFKAFEFIVSIVCRGERGVTVTLNKRLAINPEVPPEIDIPEPSDSELPQTNGDVPDNDCGSMCPDFDDGACASPGLPPTPEDEEPRTFEGVLRSHVNDYLKGTQKFSTTTELSQRVKEWEEKIKPVIEEENEREVFNIHQYGTRIMDKFADNNRKQSLPFTAICRGKRRWEVCRYFLASLILANNNNVEISATDTPSGLQDVSITLLSRKRHLDHLNAFGNNVGEHN